MNSFCANIRSKAQVFELVNKEHETKQGELSLADYSVELRAIWQDIDNYEDFQAKFSPDARGYKLKIDKLRVFSF